MNVRHSSTGRLKERSTSFLNIATDLSGANPGGPAVYKCLQGKSRNGKSTSRIDRDCNRGDDPELYFGSDIRLFRNSAHGKETPATAPSSGPGAVSDFQKTTTVASTLVGETTHLFRKNESFWQVPSPWDLFARFRSHRAF